MNKYQYKVGGVDYEVEIAEVEGNIAKVNVNGIPFEIELKSPINPARHPSLSTPKVVPPVQQPTVQAPSPSSSPVSAQPSAANVSGVPLKAPLPGTISEILVQAGQRVNAGETVLVLEAMKMKNNIETETSGTVSAILVKPNDTVKEGEVMLVIDNQ